MVYFGNENFGNFCTERGIFKFQNGNSRWPCLAGSVCFFFLLGLGQTGFLFGSSVEISSNGCRSTTRYRRSVMIISNGWRMPSSAEPGRRTESTVRDEQPVEGSSNR